MCFKPGLWPSFVLLFGGLHMGSRHRRFRVWDLGQEINLSEVHLGN